MNKDHTEIINKYFDASFIIPSLSSDELVKLVSNIIDKYLSEQNFNSEQSEDINKQIREKNVDIIKELKDTLTTIRRIKHFERLFQSNIFKLKRDIYFPDILLMSLIEATRIDLFDFIRRNQESLSISVVDIDEISSIYGTTIIEKLIAAKKQLIDSLEGNDRNLIFILFPNIEFIYKYELTKQLSNSNVFIEYVELYREIQNKNRIALNVLLSRYFSSSSIDKTIELITNQNFKDEIIKSLSKETFDKEKSLNLLSQIFPIGDENIHLRSLSLSWVYDKLEKEPLEVAFNLLIILSFIAKKNLSNRVVRFLGLEEKKQAAFQVWHYLERKGSNPEILVKLLDYENNSDEFANNVLFYTIHEDRTPKGLKLSEDIKKSVVKNYLIRLNKKIEKAMSFSDKDYFDAPLSTIWRWWQAVEFAKKNDIKIEMKKDLNNYLMNSLVNNIDFFKEFFNSYIIQDFEDEPATFRPDELYNFLTKDDIKSIIGVTLKQDNFKKLPYKFYQSMNDWLIAFDKKDELG